MKKLIIVSALMMLTAASVFAQGRITFSSGAPSVNARFATGSDHPLGSNLITASMSQFRADLFWAPGSTTVGVSDTTLVNQGNYNQLFSTVVSQAGLFLGGTRTVDLWPGGPIVAQVRVWDTSFGNFGQASNPGSIGSSFYASPLFVITPTTSPTPAPNLVGLGNGVIYTLTTIVPEPTTCALAGLGAAAMLIFRRRRN